MPGEGGCQLPGASEPAQVGVARALHYPGPCATLSQASPRTHRVCPHPRVAVCPHPRALVASGHSLSSGFGAVKSVPTESRPRILPRLREGPSIRTPQTLEFGGSGKLRPHHPCEIRGVCPPAARSWFLSLPKPTPFLTQSWPRSLGIPPSLKQKELWAAFIPRSQSCSSARSERPILAGHLQAMRPTAVHFGSWGLRVTPDPTSDL